MSAPDIDAVTPDPLDVTETAQGLLPRHCRRQALVYQILCGEIDVECKLIVHILHDGPVR